MNKSKIITLLTLSSFTFNTLIPLAKVHAGGNGQAANSYGSAREENVQPETIVGQSEMEQYIRRSEAEARRESLPADQLPEQDPNVGNLLNGLDCEEICNDVIDIYYHKKLPKYEDIEIWYNEEMKKWVDIPADERWKLLLDGARGKDLAVVERERRLYNERNDDESKEWCFKYLITGGYPADPSTGRQAHIPHDFPVAHGSRHCARAFYNAKAVGELYRKLYNIRITDDEIKLAQLAAAFHDSCRQGDYVDVFDETSAHAAHEYLITHGISEEHARKVENAINQKDANVRDEHGRVAKDPIAILLHEADCFEYLRLNGIPSNPKYLDCANLTPKEGISEKQVLDSMVSLSIKIRNLIIRTGNYEPSFDDYVHCSDVKEVAEKVGLFQTDDIDLLDPLAPELVEPKRVAGGDTEYAKLESASEEPFEYFWRENIFTISRNLVAGSLDAQVQGNRAMEQKLNRAKQLAQFCLSLERDHFTEQFAKEVVYYRLHMSANGIFDHLPKQLQLIERDGKKILVDEKRCLINSSMVDTSQRMARYVADQGGNFCLLELLGSSQTASTWAPVSVAFKHWFEHQLTPGHGFSFFYPDDRTQSGGTVVPCRADDHNIPTSSEYGKSRDFGGPQGRAMLTEIIKSEEFQSCCIDKITQFYVRQNDAYDDNAGMQARTKITDSIHLEIKERLTKEALRALASEGTDLKGIDLNKEGLEFDNELTRLFREAPRLKEIVFEKIKSLVDALPKTQKLEQSFTMLYAFNQELIHRMDFSGNDPERQTLNVYRRIKGAAIGRNIDFDLEGKTYREMVPGDTGRMTQVAVCDSTSIIQQLPHWNRVFSRNTFEIELPAHRIAYSFLLNHVLGNCPDASFMESPAMRELPAMMEGATARFIGRIYDKDYIEQNKPINQAWTAEKAWKAANTDAKWREAQIAHDKALRAEEEGRRAREKKPFASIVKEAEWTVEFRKAWSYCQKAKLEAERIHDIHGADYVQRVKQAKIAAANAWLEFQEARLNEARVKFNATDDAIQKATWQARITENEAAVLHAQHQLAAARAE